MQPTLYAYRARYRAALRVWPGLPMYEHLSVLLSRRGCHTHVTFLARIWSSQYHRRITFSRPPAARRRLTQNSCSTTFSWRPPQLSLCLHLVLRRRLRRALLEGRSEANLSSTSCRTPGRRQSRRRTPCRAKQARTSRRAPDPSRRRQGRPQAPAAAARGWATRGCP